MTDRVAGLTYNAVYQGIELLLNQNSNIVTDIVGHGGIGKTQLVQDIARNNDFGFHEITCSLLQPGDLTMPVPKDDRIEYYLNPQVQAAVDEAVAFPERKVILFLDEFNRPAAMVQGELMNLVLQRNLMGNHLPDNVIIITAENPSSDVEGFESTSYNTHARDAAINDRTMRIRMGTKLDDWLKTFAKIPNKDGIKQTIHPLITDFLEADGRQYFIIIDETRDKNPTPRAYERLSTLLYNFEAAGFDLNKLEDDALTAFLVEGIDGSIGEEAGQVFLSFLQNQQGDYIRATEVIEAEGEHLDQSVITRYQAMQAVRKKRIIEDLTTYLIDNPAYIKDDQVISRFTDLFLKTEPDQVYALINKLTAAEAGSALKQLNDALYQNDAFIDKAYDVTMSITSR